MFTFSRLIGAVLLTVATGAVAVPSGAGASTGSGAPPGRYDAAGRPVLGDGTPVTGVTFVGDGDVARARRAAGAPAILADNLMCLDKWRMIAGGGTNVNWWIEPNGNGQVHPTGNPNADYWNQLFLPCWAPGWGYAEWAFLANGNGRVVSYHRGYNNPLGTGLARASSPADLDARAKFTLCWHSDLNWQYLRIADNPVRHAQQWGNVVWAMDGPLNGDKLLHITPAIGAYTTC